MSPLSPYLAQYPGPQVGKTKQELTGLHPVAGGWEPPDSLPGRGAVGAA